MKNLIELLSDSYSPAIILPLKGGGESVKIHYSALRHAIQFTSQHAPFNNLMPGDLVCLALPNSTEFIVALFSLFNVRGVSNPIDMNLNLEEMLAHFKLVKPRFVIGLKDASNLETLKLASSSFNIPLFAISLDLVFRSIQLPTVLRQLAPERKNQLSNVKPVCSVISIGSDGPLSFVNSKKPTNNIATKHDGGDLALLLSTDGTSTGHPKLVPLSHDNIIDNLISYSKAMGLEPSDCTFLFQSLTKAHGLIGVLMSSFIRGSTVVLPQFEDSVFDESFWPKIQSFNVTFFSCTPYIHRKIMMLAKKTNKKLGNSLRFVQSTGSPLKDTQLLEMERLYGCPIITSYYSTEASSFIASHTPSRTRKLGSVGQPLSLTVLIFNDKGARITNGIGEICISGKSVFKGYFDQTEKNHFFFFEYEGKKYFKTGDNGFLDERGFLVMTGRKSDQLHLSGQLGDSIVSPAILDRVLFAHPSIEAVAFFASHGKLECAVVLKTFAHCSEAELKQWLTALVPSQLPDHIYFVKSLARTESGKIQRFSLSSAAVPAASSSKL